MVQIMETLHEKKTFNINSRYAELMRRIIPSRKQTEFVNRAIGRELERELEKTQRADALEKLKEFRAYREASPKVKKPSEEVLAEMRSERSEYLSNLSSKNA